MSDAVLVLGASGFIGQRVTRALQDAGMRCIAAGRRGRAADPAIEYLQLDATDGRTLASALGGVQGVVNCVAGSPETITANARALFAAAAASTAAPVVVHFSSMAVYGSSTGEVDESAPMKGDTGAYAAAKVEAERLAGAYAKAVCLRPGIVYGPGSAQWSERVGRWLMARRVGDLGAAGDGCCNLVHVDDVARACVEALRRPEALGKAFNLGMRAPPTWNEYFIAYARALGAVPVRRVTARRLKVETKLLAPPLKILEIAAGKARLGGVGLPPPIPPSLARSFRQDLRLKPDRAERLLGLRWAELGAALQDTARWFQRR